jgi:hypothetical protein
VIDSYNVALSDKKKNMKLMYFLQNTGMAKITPIETD